MPALNFRKQFAPLVKSGFKHQTIRRKRKKAIKVGDRLVLYTGMRTKYCRKLGESVCESTHSIRITPSTVALAECEGAEFKDLAPWEAEELAKADGFADLDAFFNFFFPPRPRSAANLHADDSDEYLENCFDGHLIRWGNVR